MQRVYGTAREKDSSAPLIHHNPSDPGADQPKETIRKFRFKPASRKFLTSTVIVNLVIRVIGASFVARANRCFTDTFS